MIFRDHIGTTVEDGLANALLAIVTKKQANNQCLNFRMVRLRNKDEGLGAVFHQKGHGVIFIFSVLV